jgi:hypothetical protein
VFLSLLYLNHVPTHQWMLKCHLYYSRYLVWFFFFSKSRNSKPVNQRDRCHGEETNAKGQKNLNCENWFFFSLSISNLSIFYIFNPLINRNTSLKHECTTLLYKSLIRPIITYSSPVWFGTSSTNFNKLRRLQNKILRISFNAPRFTRNTQIHWETNTPTLKDFITTLTLNFHSRLPLATGAIHYSIGQTSIQTRLKPRLSQGLLN